MKNDWMRNMTDTVTQVSILDALLARKFDGCLPCRELLKYGDFGVGTYDRMDGEMIIVDGRLYQGKGDGKVYEPDPDNRTPFATVCWFQPERTWALGGHIDLAGMKKEIDVNVSNQNVFVAVRVEGIFSSMKTQALQIQNKPYPSTAEVVKGCVHREIQHVTGTIVGFRSPPYVRGIGDPGYHLHFLSKDKTQGGHVLDFALDRGECSVDICYNFHVILPEEGATLADIERKSTRLNSSHRLTSRMPSSA
jgi:acetolactate decarboxylase